MTNLSKLSSYFFFIALIGFVLVAPACKNDVTFAEENKMAIDTMFANRKIKMQKEIDSLCATNNADFYDTVYDSILEARIAQIEKALKSVKSKTQ